MTELPDEVKDRAKKIKEENEEITEEEAIAIARDQLDMAEHDCPEGQVYVGGECRKIDTEEVDAPPSALSDGAQFTLSELETDPIEREELGENEVAYRNVKVLQSGAWTDSGSGETIWYSPRGLDNLEVRENNSINIMHDAGNEVSEVGYMENPRAQDGELYADLVIDTSNAAGEYADENLQQTLESSGQKGFGGPSVEIDAEGQEVEYNTSRGMKELVKGYISGLGLVKNPASKPVSFARQTANRGVALSEGANAYTLEQKGGDMSDKELQGMEEVMGAVAGALTEVHDDATDMYEAAEDAEEFAGALSNILDTAEETIAENLEEMDLADAELEEEDYDEEEEEEERENQDMDDVLEMVQELRSRLEAVEEEHEQLMNSVEEDTEELSAEIEEAKEGLASAETVQELEEAKEDLEKRLSEVENQPEKPRSMADFNGEEEVEITGRITEVGDPDPY